jgi:hypothetical protein
MRWPPRQNPSPQTPVRPGFVVSGIPKTRGLSGSAHAARTVQTLPFERVQTTPAPWRSRLRIAPERPPSAAFERVQLNSALCAKRLIPLAPALFSSFERVQMTTLQGGASQPASRHRGHAQLPLAFRRTVPDVFSRLGSTPEPADLRANDPRAQRLQVSGLQGPRLEVQALRAQPLQVPASQLQALCTPSPRSASQLRAQRTHSPTRDPSAPFERVQTSAPSAPSAPTTPFKVTPRHPFERVQTARQQPTLVPIHRTPGGTPLHPPQ